MGIFELLYYLGYRIKKSRSFNNQKSLPGKVISIGNITVGGTGKTPAVIAAAREALKRGLNPCILTRGYKGKMKGPCFVSVGEGPLIAAEYAGDEPALMAWKLGGVPIVKSADRYEGGMFAIKELKPSEAGLLFILDDGYQHWRLRRDVDILLIDSRNPFGSGKLLPVGTLREPIKEIRRADIIVLTKAEGPEPAADLSAEIRKHNGKAPIFTSSHRLTGIIRPSGEEIPIEQLRDTDAYAFCGIGDPGSFRFTLLEAGIKVKGFKVFGDHYAFKVKDLRAIERDAARLDTQWIITTEKDIIRLRGLGLPDNIVAAGIEFDASEGFFDEVFGRL